MYIALTVFLVSFLGLAAMIGLRVHYDHIRERELFNPVVSRARKANTIMRNLVDEVRSWVKYCNKRTLVLLTHFVIEKIEDYFHKLLDWARSKLPPHK